MNIAIIGAGPVGLSLAVLLARQGHALTVFDGKALEQTVADPRTLALSQGSRELLDKCGAWPDLSVPITHIDISQQAKGLASMASIQLSASNFSALSLGYTVKYGDLVKALHAQACTHEALITLRYNTRVEDAKALEHTHDLTIVCEGGLFATQTSKPIHRDYEQLAYIATVKASQFKPGHAYERFTLNGPLALLPLRDAHHGYSMVWCRPELTLAQREDKDWCESEINSAFGNSVGELSIASPLIAVPLGLSAHWRLVQGKRVTIGNAAQTLHPVAGQGFNLGLRDAWVLASLLAEHEGDVSGALRRYANERIADRSAMMFATDFFARSFTWDVPGASTLRAAGLAAITLLPGAKRALAGWMMRGLR